VNLTISCDTIPPKKAHTGEISARAHDATFNGTVSVHSWTPANQFNFPSFDNLEYSSYNSLVLFTISSAWALLLNSGRALFLA
jgi:hypothetical protein